MTQPVLEYDLGFMDLGRDLPQVWIDLAHKAQVGLQASFPWVTDQWWAWSAINQLMFGPGKVPRVESKSPGLQRL